MATSYVGNGTSLSYAAAAAANGAGDGGLLLVFYALNSSSAVGPTSITYGGVSMLVAHQAYARTGGQGSGTFRNAVVAILPLEGVSFVGTNVVVTHPGQTVTSIRTLLLKGVDQTVTLAGLVWGVTPLIDVGEQFLFGPHWGDLVSPSLAVDVGGAMAIGAYHTNSAIGAPAYSVNDAQFTMVDTTTSPPTSLPLGYAVAQSARTVQFTWRVGIGLSTPPADNEPQFMLALPAAGPSVATVKLYSVFVSSPVFKPIQLSNLDGAQPNIWPVASPTLSRKKP